MADGSVIVDLAVERGGNVEGAVPGEVAKVGGVTIIGHLNMAGRIAASSSALLARNIYAFVEPMIDKATKALSIKRDDEIVAATLLTADGAIVHPAFAPKPAARGRAGLMENEALERGRRSAREEAARARPPTRPSRRASRPSRRRRSRSARTPRSTRPAPRRMRRRGGVDRPVRLPPLDLRAGDLRRLLRRLVGDAGAAHAADERHQRHLLGHRGRRAARRRRAADRRGDRRSPALFGFLALMLASVNIFGGFLVTQRMLAMYKRKERA